MSRFGEAWTRIWARLTGSGPDPEIPERDVVDGQQSEEAEAPEDDSLDAQAWRRAHDLDAPHAGTPFDWEDWQKYQQEKPDDNDS